MKKVQSNKLTLGKMTVAKLRLSQQQMQLINGGEDTKPTTRPTGGGNQSFFDDPNNPCVSLNTVTGT
jgi:hypothetical protein